MPIVFSKPHCVQCTASYNLLDNLGLEYETRNIAEDAEAEAVVKGLGYMAAPVIYISEDNHWAGFNPDKIKELAQS